MAKTIKEAVVEETHPKGKPSDGGLVALLDPALDPDADSVLPTFPFLLSL
jgi:cephalosporin-C deacetylase-like acetyl esterase